MKKNNGSLKDVLLEGKSRVCVGAIPELVHGKQATRAGLRTPSAWFYFKPGDKQGQKKGCPWDAGQRCS